MDDATEESGETIAELARKMTPDRRGRFLDAACGGDPELRADVEARLQAGSDAADMGQANAESSSPDPFDAMVLEAVSTTQEPEGSPAEEADGGVPILLYCREKGLAPVARLRLFQQVCRLIDDAHRRGVIDGGLTPERIRIGSDGQPSISEFASSPDEAEHSDRLRHTSPEQVLGEPITTATDVYGLGMVLYELLTGRYPYRTTGDPAGRDELAEAISQQAPERPSRVVASEGSHQALRKLLDGDLDLIVLKALQKEPDRRYRSAAALAEDIDRFFEGGPVLAHPPGKLYVAGKFLGRHRVLATLAMLLFTALLTGLLLTSLGLSRTRRERDRTEALAQAARTSMDDVFTRIDQEHLLSTPDAVASRSALLESFLKYYERTSEPTDQGVQARQESAQTRRRIGRIYELMGLPDVASWQYKSALDAFQQLADESPGTSHFLEERAGLLGKLGELARVEGNRQADARAFLERAQALLESGTPAGQASSSRRRILARVLASLAGVEQAEGHQEQAAATWRRAVEINKTLASGSASAEEDRIAFVDSLIGLGRVLMADPQTARQGMDEYTRGVELRQAIVHAAPMRVDQAVELAREFRELSYLYQSAGQLGQAEENARRAVEVYAQLDRRFPETLAYETDLYIAEDALSRLLALTNETKAALERSNRVRAMLERLAARYPRNRQFAIDLSKCHNLIGKLQRRRRAYAEALQSFQRAADMLEGAGQLRGDSSYQLAANLSLCISLFGAGPDTPPPDDESTLSPADQLRRKVYGKRAVEALTRAVAEGITNVELYQTDDDLDSLRDRPDFQELVKELADRSKSEKATGP